MTRSQLRILKEFTAELLGTAVLIMFGCGCVAQAVLSNKENGSMLSINLGWGFGVLIGIMVAGPISGEEIYQQDFIRKVYKFHSDETRKINNTIVPAVFQNLSLPDGGGREI